MTSAGQSLVVVVQGFVAARTPVCAPEAELLADAFGATAGPHYVGASEVAHESKGDAVVIVECLDTVVAPLVNDVLPFGWTRDVLHEHCSKDQRPSSNRAGVEDLFARDEHALTHLDLALTVPLDTAIASLAT